MKILFHCFGGINRSAAVLCAWLIAAYGYSAEDAIKLLLKETVSSPVAPSRLCFGPVAPSRLCFGGIVDGGTTAL
jgi:hypothetical protein